MLFNQGTKPGQEGGVDLGIETIQFGAPASSGSDNEVGPVLSEKSTDKLPEPKEQRQKQPRAGPIKAQKVKSHHFSKCVNLKKFCQKRLTDSRIEYSLN